MARRTKQTTGKSCLSLVFHPHTLKVTPTNFVHTGRAQFRLSLPSHHTTTLRPPRQKISRTTFQIKFTICFEITGLTKIWTCQCPFEFRSNSPAVINVDLTSFKQAINWSKENVFSIRVGFVLLQVCFAWAALKMFHNPSFICDWYDFALMDFMSFHTPVYEFSRVVFSNTLLMVTRAPVSFLPISSFFWCVLFFCHRLLWQVVQTSHALATHLKQIKGGNRIFLYLTLQLLLL